MPTSHLSRRSSPRSTSFPTIAASTAMKMSPASGVRWSNFHRQRNKPSWLPNRMAHSSAWSARIPTRSRFADTEPWDATVDALLTQLMTQLPAAVRQLDDFLDLDNQRSIAGLARHGFIVRGLTHVYEALRPLTPISIEQRLPLLADADKEAFRELHDALFPATYKNGTQILAERDADHRVFAYHNGELLGYLYAAPSESADAGYIHYVGVREDARNQGIGYRLVTSALHWMFEERGWTKVNLTVADTHEQARALYARSGFRLLYTGVGQRKTW
jgi:GNAT superfamily N-acetyltransferase